MAKVTAAGYVASASPKDVQEVVTKWKYATVNLADNTTTVFGSPCRIGKIWVTVVMSAHICVIKDGSVALLGLPASSAVNATFTQLENTVTLTSLVVDPDDSNTGTIIIQYSPL